MKRAILILTTLTVGCATDDAPTPAELHTLTTCSSAWTVMAGTEACEAACADPHPTDRAAGDNDPNVCAATYVSTAGEKPATCFASMQFDFRGVRGCCVFGADRLDNGLVPIRFAVCEGG